MNSVDQSTAWGILATGRIASRFAEALAVTPGADLQAVASRSLDSAQDFASKHRAISAYGSYEELLRDPAVQAIYISPPHPFHAEWAIRCAEAGKHILCEKPVGLNYPEAMTILEAVRANGVFFMEAFMYRCHPMMTELVKLIREGVIGRVRLIRSTFSFSGDKDPNCRHLANDLGGGGIMDVGCYPVSFSRLVAGAALGKPYADAKLVKGVAEKHPETGVDIHASAVLHFEGDILAQATCGVGAKIGSRAEVIGDGGRIIIENPWFSQGSILVKTPRENREVFPQNDKDLYQYEIEIVGDCIAKGQVEAMSPAMSWGDTLGNMQALDAWRDSVGLIYEREKPSHPEAHLTLAKRTLSVRPQHNMSYGQIPGVNKQISRLFMGVDNQPNFPYACAIFDYFYELGGNAFDTAAQYAFHQRERNLGNWFATRGVRDSCTVIVKGAHSPFCWPQYMPTEFRDSMEALQTDYADIYMMHRDNPEIPVGEFVSLLSGWQSEGKVRTYGFSNWTIPRLNEAIAYARDNGLHPPRVLSNNLSLARMIDEVWAGVKAASDDDFREWLTSRNGEITLLSWSSQARGFFTDRAAPDKLGDTELVRCWYSPENFERKARATQLAQQKGVLPLNIALAYVLHQAYPTFALFGPRTLEEIRTSLPALDVSLTPEEVRWLDLRE